MHRSLGITSAFALLASLEACSLIIDTNPDGVIPKNRAGSAGQAAGAGRSATAGSTSSSSNPGSSGANASTAGGAANVGGASNTGGASNKAGSGNAGGTPSSLGGTSTQGGSAGSLAINGGLGAIAGRSGGTGGTTGGFTGGTSTSGIATGGAAMAGTGGKTTGGATTGGATTGGAATGGAATGGAATGGSGVGGCPGTGGPTMVALPEGYCIDSTEVTRWQYSEWLKTTTSATVAAQEQATCSWNTSFDPTVSYPECVTATSCATSCESRPQRCVDWCDAVAYCKGVGKRLCGKIGGGAFGFGNYADHTESQWYNACSSHGANLYPYGNAYQAANCNGPENQIQDDLRVKSFGLCQAAGAYSGVFDLSGNVKEFQDGCQTSAADSPCIATGGGAWNWYLANPSLYPSYMSCGSLNHSRRNAGATDIGFRCCAP